ncbi:hypothetical protein [Rhodobacter maris]|uniref:Uncharacterized protein n=1 Tax=Rhodobacter maris TaxID=446682 RepID=A0A285SRF8_9RHOB|nr:hypothetical protein [Rhodobacter maris]SOC10278.1 hypothetical protein SAMN05877831_10841 [Rhodobacter maris]
MHDPKRETLTLMLDGREVRLVPTIIEGYELEIDRRNITSFLSHSPPMLRAVAALEAHGTFGVGDLELASDRKKWVLSGGSDKPAEKK